LVIRAHGRIYRADPAEGRRRIRDFFARDFPSTFRRTWRYTALAFSACLLFAALSFIGTWRDPEFSELAGVPAYARERILERKPRWWKGDRKSTRLNSSHSQISYAVFCLKKKKKKKKKKIKPKIN